MCTQTILSQLHMFNGLDGGKGSGMTRLNHLHWPLIPGMGALALPGAALHRADGCTGAAVRPSTSRAALALLAWLLIVGLAPVRTPICTGLVHGAVSALIGLAARARYRLTS